MGAALVLLGAGAIALSTSFDDAPYADVLRGNRPVNAGAGNLGDISAHNSPTLARNPRDGANLAVANRIDTPRFSCALHVSSTGGARWSQTPIPLPRGEEPKCYAPDVAFGADGTLYFSFVTLSGRGNVPHAVWIARSRDGGRTLSEPVKAGGPLAFQVRLTADPSKPERLHLTWLQGSEVGLLKFTETGNPIQAATSDDGGRTWTQPVRVSGPGRERVVAPSPATGPGGELYVHRCHRHKERNVVEHLPERDRPAIQRRLRAAWALGDHGLAQSRLEVLAAELDRSWPDAARSLREGLAETLTLMRLGISGQLAKTLSSTNPCESMIEIVRHTQRNVKSWQSGDMRLRWSAAGMLEAERQFRRIIGYRDLARLALAVEREVAAATSTTAQEQQEVIAETVTV